MLLLATQPSESARQAIQFVRGVFNARTIAFYKVDGKMDAYDYTLHNVPADFHRLYIEHMSRFDPLHVHRLSGRNSLIGRFGTCASFKNENENPDYRAFFEKFGIVDSVEMLFRSNGKVYGGMSICWAADGASSVLQPGVIESVRDYLEFTLTPVQARALPYEQYGLTRREKEVVEMLCCGQTNQDISMTLGMGIATVKTHLIHIYEKLGVENRSSAVGLLSRHVSRQVSIDLAMT